MENNLVTIIVISLRTEIAKIAKAKIVNHGNHQYLGDGNIHLALEVVVHVFGKIRHRQCSVVI